MELKKAYLAARAVPFEAATSTRVRNYRKGPTPAHAAIARARVNLANAATDHATHDMAKADLVTLMATMPAGSAFAYGKPWGGRIGITPATPEGDALYKAIEAQEARVARLSRLAIDADSRAGKFGLAGDYGAGTWQRPDPDARPTSARLWYYHGSDALRDVTDAADVCRLDRGGRTGWITDPEGDYSRDGTGLCLGVVGRLRARGGRAGFVPGYRFGGTEDNGTFDFAAIIWADGSEESDMEKAQEDCARTADGMAEHAADKERDYQTAWQAGCQWSHYGETIATLRKSALRVLSERRAARGIDHAGFPTLCQVIRDKVESILSDIQEARDARAELAESYWDKRQEGAFCEGAGLEAMPA